MTGSSYPIGSLPDQRSEQKPFHAETGLHDKFNLCAEPEVFVRRPGWGEIKNTYLQSL